MHDDVVFLRMFVVLPCVISASVAVFLGSVFIFVFIDRESVLCDNIADTA